MIGSALLPVFSATIATVPSVFLYAEMSTPLLELAAGVVRLDGAAGVGLYRSLQLTNVFVQPYFGMYNYSELGLK